MKSQRPWALLRALCVVAVLTIMYSACANKSADDRSDKIAGTSSDETENEGLVEGDCQTVYEGEVCTWGRMIGDKVVEFGATVPMSSIENAPADIEMTWPPNTIARIRMPEAVTSSTGIKYLGMNWEAHGHPPGPYLTPHFDFHFNTVGEADIAAIDCSDSSKPDEVPAGFTLPDITIPELGMLVGLCVPEMGMHALSEEEMNSDALFGATMIVGYYTGDVIFVEPMIAKAKLEEEQNFSLDVPEVADAGAGVAWPAGFNAEYDESTNAYRFVFSMPSTD